MAADSVFACWTSESSLNSNEDAKLSHVSSGISSWFTSTNSISSPECKRKISIRKIGKKGFRSYAFTFDCRHNWLLNIRWMWRWNGQLRLWCSQWNVLFVFWRMHSLKSWRHFRQTNWANGLLFVLSIDLPSNVIPNSMFYLHVLEVNSAVPCVGRSYNWRWWTYSPYESEFRKNRIEKVVIDVMAAVKRAFRNRLGFGHLHGTAENDLNVAIVSSEYFKFKKEKWPTFIGWNQKLWHPSSFDCHKLWILLGMHSLKNIKFWHWIIFRIRKFYFSTPMDARQKVLNTVAEAICFSEPV